MLRLSSTSLHELNECNKTIKNSNDFIKKKNVYLYN